MYKYSLKLIPFWMNDTVSSMKVEIKTDHPVKKDSCAFERIDQVVGIPFCPFAEQPVLTDSIGIIPVHEEALPVYESFIHPRALIAERDSEGSLTLTYTITPRVQPEDYRSSPYFDFVAEKGGANGCGNTFLYSLPERDDDVNFDLTWDLSRLPDDAEGIWTFSNQSHARKDAIRMMDILWTAFMCGKVNCVEEGPVGFYWLDSLPFDARDGASRVVRLFVRMSEMFHDKGGDYRIFARHNGFPGSGGTALKRSYIYGYGKDDAVSLDELQDLLAHEMVHNWPTMKDDPAGLGTWYVEGSAEYYSTMVPFELGMRSAEKTAEVINRKAGAYWKNPMHHLSNMELGKLYWKDGRCQRVPYQRGVLFLANTDAGIRKATDGRKTLLDVEVKLLENKGPMPEDFLEAVREVSGLDLKEAYENMCNGQDPVPDPDAFGGYFTVNKALVHEQLARHVVDQKDDGPLVEGYVWEVRK